MSCVSTIYFEQMLIALAHSLNSTMLKNCVLMTTFCHCTLSTGNVHIQDIFICKVTLVSNQYPDKSFAFY